MLIREHKINKYKYKLKYLHISAGIKKINDSNNIYSMTNMPMNCRDDNTCISVTISNVRILCLKHLKVVTSLKSGDNFPQRLGPK